MVWLLIGYMFLFIHRPSEVWPGLADYRIELVYILVTGAVWAVSPGKRWLANPLHGAILAFAAAVLLCWGVSPWASFGQRVVEDYFKVIVFYVLLVTAISDERSLKRVSLGFLAVMALYMAHSLWEYRNGRHTFRMDTPRMIGVDTTLGDPNSFGATILYSLPFLVPFWVCTPTLRVRAFLAGYLGLAVLCIGLTGSRSAFIGLLVWAAVTVWRSGRRWQTAVATLVALPLFWLVLPPALQSRFETIVDPTVGPANARESADSRLEALPLAAGLWSDNPLTGCGPGAWRKATGRKVESHNLYGQVLGEMGTLGVATFGAVMLAIWVNLRRIARLYREHPEWGQDFIYHLTRAIGVAVLLLLFEGNFGHNLFRYSWLWYAAFLTIARYCVEQRLLLQTASGGTESTDAEAAPDGGPCEWIGTAA